ncbi:MAG: hypothetical protein ABWY78_18540 [Microvirga sp.]
MALLTEAIDEALSAIDTALARVETAGDTSGEATTAGLNDVRSHILSILWLVERNPGIEAAADDLYQAAAVSLRATADAGGASRHRRILSDATARFRARLALAAASAQAQRLGLT